MAVETLMDLITQRVDEGIASKTQVAESMDMTWQGLWLHLIGKSKKFNSPNWNALAAALHVPIERVLAAVSAPAAPSPAPPEKEAGKEPPLGITQNIRVQPEIPIWDIDVAAGRWSPVPIAELNLNDPRQRRIVERGLFRLRIEGDCMEPDYPHGSVIEFQLFRHDDEPLIVNSDYVFCRIDGTATFKKLVAKTDEILSLAAINQLTHPGIFTVPTQEIGRMAKVAVPNIPPPLKPRAIRIVERKKGK